METYTPEELQKELSKLKTLGGGSSFLKLSLGQHKLRFGPAAHGAPAPFVARISHGKFPGGLKTADGKIESPTCLTQVLEDGPLTQMALGGDDPKLGSADVKAFKKHGCPFCSMNKKVFSLAKTDEQKKFANEFRPNIQVLWNVQDKSNGRLFIWSSYQTFAEQMVQNLAIRPKLFDVNEGNDVYVPVTQKNATQKSVGAPIVGEVSKFDPTEELFDLRMTVVSGVRTFEHMKELISLNFGDKLSELGK